MSAKLVVVDGSRKGQSFLLESDCFTVGRQEGNHLQLLETSVSRRHCELCRLGEGYELHDLESSHGTFVDGRPVVRHRLRHGDFLQVGSTTLLFFDSLETSRAGVPEQGNPSTTVERRPEEIAAMLEKNSRESSGEVALLFEIATSVQQHLGAEALAQRLLECLGRSLPAQRGVVLGGGQQEDRGQLIATWGAAEGVRPSRTLMRRIREEQVALVWDDVQVDPQLTDAKSLHGAYAHSLLAAPLAGRRDLHGIVYFESTKRGAFTPAHLELTATAAALVGLTFDTLRAFDDLREENQRLQLAGIEHGLVGESPLMRRLLDFIAKVAPVDSTVLLRGESGTGKELAALALHRASLRAKGPFVAINCATLSETLLESELFGHERGAFTGAVQRKLGKFEAADHGTLFLDEIGEMPAHLQARLLRALQERRIERVGGTQSIPVDVRVVAATNRDLEAAMKSGLFREDLFYRLNVISRTLPPLRERREDVPLLARHFARIHGERMNRRGLGFDAVALRALAAYDWPGNVRQLSNAIERALVLGDGEMIRLEDLPEELIEKGAPEVELGGFQSTMIETKKHLLLTTLAEANGNAAEAGRRLGLHPNSFRRLMRQLGLRESAAA